MRLSKSKFIDQPTKMYWKTDYGKKEITFEEKRFIAMLEATDMVLQNEMEVDYELR